MASSNNKCCKSILLVWLLMHIYTCIHLESMMNVNMTTKRVLNEKSLFFCHPLFQAQCTFKSTLLGGSFHTLTYHRCWRYAANSFDLFGPNSTALSCRGNSPISRSIHRGSTSQTGIDVGNVDIDGGGNIQIEQRVSQLRKWYTSAWLCSFPTSHL